MKIIEAFFEVIKQCFVICNKCCAGSLNKFFIVHAKVVIFSSIFIPCLLQFPFVAFGQDRANIINGSHVSIIGFEKWRDINAIGLVADVCNFWSESGFKGCDSAAIHLLFAPSSTKDMINNCSGSGPNEAERESEQNFFGITHNNLNVALSLLFGFVCGSLHAHLLVFLGMRKG